MKKSFLFFSLIVLFVFSNINCGSTSPATDSTETTTETLSSLESSIFDVENLPVTIAKLDSINPSKVHLTDVTDSVSLSQNGRFLTTQSTCNVVLEITIDEGGVPNPTTTPGIFLYHMSLGYSESYSNIVQSNGAVLASSDVQICAASSSDQILVAGLTSDGQSITIPVMIELNNGNEILSLTASSSNLANSQNILVSSDGQVYAVVLDGLGGSTIYELQANGSTGNIIATLSDIPIVLDIFDIGSTTYLYYFNQSGVFKELTITSPSASINSNFLARSTPLYTATEATIEDFSVDTDSNFVILHEEQNDGNGSMIVMIQTINENNHRSMSQYRRQSSGDLSNAIQASPDNTDKFLGYDALGLVYAYIAGDQELDDCNFDAGCVVSLSTNSLGSFSDSEDSEVAIDFDSDDIHLIISDESTNAVTLVLSLVPEVDTTSDAPPSPNGLLLREDGLVTYFDSDQNTIQLAGDTSEPILSMGIEINSDEQTLIVGCQQTGSDRVLSVFVPSSDSALSDQLQNGSWQKLTTPGNFQPCSADEEINLESNLSLYFYRTDSDGNQQISFISFENNETLQSGLMNLLP